MSAVDRAAAGIARWVEFYTAGLDPRVAADRRSEMRADIHDQTAWSRDAGREEFSIARDLRGRAFRGAPADLLWSLTASWRTGLPAIEHPLRFVVSGMAVALLALGMAGLSRRPLSEAPVDGLLLLSGVVLAGGALVLLARWRTRALGALWVVASAQIVLLDGIAYLAGSTTILAHVVGTEEWAISLLLADLGVAVVCLGASIWWASAERTGGTR